MTVKETFSVRISRETKESAAKLSDQTGESMTAVIEKAVRKFEDDLFYERLSEATSQTFDKGAEEKSYRAETQPWLDADLTDLASEPEEKFWQ